MNTQRTVKTRFLIISDTHSAPLRTTADFPFSHPLPKADVLLHCGDLTNGGSLEEFQSVLDMLGQIDAELKLVIAGNHDVGLDKDYKGDHGVRCNVVRAAKKEAVQSDWQEYVEKAKQLWTEEQAIKNKVVYLEEGLRQFHLSNGATFSIYTSPYQPAFCNWAFDYKRHEDRWNPPNLVSSGTESISVNPVPSFPSVDIIMTHGPLHSHLDLTHSRVRAGCSHLLKAVARARPRLFCCGHIHESSGSERLHWDTDKVEAIDAETDPVNCV